MPLEKEIATYKRELPRLLEQAGKYVVIFGDEVASTWQTYEDALQAGYQKFGLQPFMVKKIELHESVRRFTRDITQPCRS